jgi:hypothetical protein
MLTSTNKNIDLKNPLFILESIEANAFYKQDDSPAKADDVLMRLKGIFATMDVHNGGNNHRYSFDNYDAQVQRLLPTINRKGLMGELEHRNSRNIDDNLVSHRIDEIWYNPELQRYEGWISLLDTVKGRNAYGIAKSGSPLYISSRAIATVDDNTGDVAIQELVTWDLTGSPGFTDAEWHDEAKFLNATIINESIAAFEIPNNNIDIHNQNNNSNQNINEMDKTEITSLFNTLIANKMQDSAFMNFVVESVAFKSAVNVAAQQLIADGNFITESVVQQIIANNNSQFVTIDAFDGYVNEQLMPSVESHINENAQQGDFITQSQFDGYIQQQLLPMFDEYFNAELLPNASNFANENAVNAAIMDKYINEALLPMFDKYISIELLPELKTRFANENALGADTMDKYINESLLPMFDDYFAKVLIPSIKAKFVNENVSIESGESYIAISALEFTATDQAPKVINIDDIITIDSIVDNLVHVNFDDILYSVNKEQFLNSVVEFNADTDDMINESIILAKQTIKDALLSNNDKYINESFVKLMPKQYSIVWMSMDDKQKAVLAKQASLRTDMVTESKVAEFWHTRQLSNDDFVNEHQHSQRTASNNMYGELPQR